MKSLYSFTSPDHECTYLPEQMARMRYEIVGSLSGTDFEKLLAKGWRHFGHTLFRPRCASCRACQSIRVPVNRFTPNRSQRRAWQANQDVTVVIAPPSVTDEKIELYDRFHSFQVGNKGWPAHSPHEASSYHESFVDNPFLTEEWQFMLGDQLIGVGYVDRLPSAMSAIYFFYEPAMRERSLGTFNILCILKEAARAGIPYLYLGYFVEGCRSLEYKANFQPNQVLSPRGGWINFRT